MITQGKQSVGWDRVTMTSRKATGNVQPYLTNLETNACSPNILSSNYCQPKCGAPWVEVKFKDENQGKERVVTSPLMRLPNKPNASIEDIGSPEKLMPLLVLLLLETYMIQMSSPRN